MGEFFIGYPFYISDFVNDDRWERVKNTGLYAVTRIDRLKDFMLVSRESAESYPYHYFTLDYDDKSDIVRSQPEIHAILRTNGIVPDEEIYIGQVEDSGWGCFFSQASDSVVTHCQYVARLNGIRVDVNFKHDREIPQYSVNNGELKPTPFNSMIFLDKILLEVGDE